MLGHPGRAEFWAAAAETGDSSGPGLGGESSEAWLALLRSFLCRDGIDQMRVDAVMARDKLTPASVWRPTALLLEALADLMDGDDDRAESIFAHAYDVAVDCGAVLAATVALAERASIHADRHDWIESERFAEQALSMFDSTYVIGNATTAFVVCRPRAHASAPR